MSDPRYEFFFTSVDQEANRRLARQITTQVVEQVRPDESLFTDPAFDTLMTNAARGAVIPAGAGVKFGFGAAELLVMVVVPAVVTALTNAFDRSKVAGIYGVEQPADTKEFISRDEIKAIIQDTHVRVGSAQINLLHDAINQRIEGVLQRAAANQSQRQDSRCGIYDCKALRKLFETSFTLEDMRDLAFDLNVDHNNVVTEKTVSSCARVLIEYFLLRSRLEELVAYAKQQRPDVDWSHITRS